VDLALLVMGHSVVMRVTEATMEKKMMIMMPVCLEVNLALLIMGHSNRLMRDAMSISSDEDDTAKEAETKLVTPEDNVLYEVLEEIYDVNGKVHQAVRMGTSVNSQGTQGRQVARFCVNKYKARQQRGFSSMYKCPLYRTRVKCLQCNMPLCYPLKFSHNEEKRKNSICFMTHVNAIERDNVELKRKFVRTVSNEQNEQGE